METQQIRVRITPHDIAFLCHLMTSYGELAIVRTIDQRQGLVELLVAPDFCETVGELLQALKHEMGWQLMLEPLEDALAHTCNMR